MCSNDEANPKTMAQLGELVVAAYDDTERDTVDPREVARLATRVVIHMVRHARRAWPAPRR